MAIKVDTAIVRTMAGEISKLNGKINDDFVPLQTAVNTLSRSWSGTASVNATNKFRSIRNTFYDNRYNIINDMVNFMYNQISTGYETTETNITNVAEQFR